jgi:hypothetical protein
MNTIDGTRNTAINFSKGKRGEELEEVKRMLMIRTMTRAKVIIAR